MDSPRDPAPGLPEADITRMAPVVATFRAGDLLCDRFRVVRFIARGGMGELYEAEDLTLGERVALKTIRSEIAVHQKANQRFLREVQLARKVTHPNICRIFDLFEHRPPQGTAGAVSFVTMELLQGETLSQYLRTHGPLSVEDARPIVQQMAAALSAAHAADVIHRDFKTNNVMLLEAGPSRPPRVVVTDFGLAHLVGDASGITNEGITVTGDVPGTPEYMSPEQIEGGVLTPASDIYALGIVIYEMVTGQRPFAADTPIASALKRVVEPAPKSPRELRPDLPASWERTILRCLSRRPEHRFADATEIVRALDSATAQPVPQSRLVWAAAVALVVVAAVGTFLWRSNQASPPAAQATTEPAATRIADVVRPAVAVLGFRNLTGREDAKWLSTALSEMLTTELGAGERLRTIPGENVTRMKTELALADADTYASETLTRIRRNLGADLVVTGSYVTVGAGDESTLRVDIRLQDSREGETLSLVSEMGRVAELLEVVARAGERLRDKLGVQTPETPVRASQPGSPEAARLYAEGLIRLR